MRAWLIVTGEDGRRLELRDAPDPSPRPGEVLVRVRAAGVNRADLARNPYHYAHADRAAPPIAGLEMAGEVAAVGAGVSAFRVGDRVMAMASGSYAELVRVPAQLAMPVPAPMSWEEAGATPVAFLTAHDALLTHGRACAGESVLIHAVTSGVGVAALQLAKVAGARPVLGTSGLRDKLARLAKRGLDVGIDHREESIADRVLAATDRHGADVVIDSVGGSVFTENIRCLALRGRLVQIGRLGGATAEIDLDEVARKRLTLIGVTFRTRSLEEHAAIVRAFLDHAYLALASGQLVTVVDRVFPFAEVTAAHEYLRTNAHLGKVVLRV
jgi:NADPH2:quinone reductase